MDSFIANGYFQVFHRLTCCYPQCFSYPAFAERTMSLDSIKTVAVLGAGTMGNGIAHVFARAGYSVILRDVDQSFLERALGTIGKNLDREIKKGKLPESEKPAVLSRIKTVIAMSAIAAADFAIEAVPEKLEIKRAVLSEADKILRPEVILASNTSSISMTTLAAFTLTLELTKKLGKTGVAVNDAPGFVSNRVLMPMINEAAYCVMEGVATPEAVDSVMRLGMNHPMGPLELADFIGLDVCVDILQVLEEGLGVPKYRACPLLKKYVAAGWLGRKSSRGFYTYS